jgi:hypothetical protein
MQEIHFRLVIFILGSIKFKKNLIIIITFVFA